MVGGRLVVVFAGAQITMVPADHRDRAVRKASSRVMSAGRGSNKHCVPEMGAEMGSDFPTFFPRMGSFRGIFGHNLFSSGAQDAMLPE